MSYESILADLGHRLVSANSGIEALEKLMAGEFAVILLDVSMPGMDGFETASLIHDHPRFEKTPIIFVTGVHVTELDRLQGYKVGAVDYVYIPLVPEVLRGKVAVLVELYRQRRELQRLNRHLARANAELAQAHAELEARKTRELEALNADLKRANADLASADRQKDQFLAMLAHELRNPLAPIRNALQIMRRKGMADPELVWTREVIERQLVQLSRLVDDLLDVSRITRGKINVSREVIELGTLIERGLETAQPLIGERRHELAVDVPDGSVRLYGDLTRLTQVVGNILSNAAKYTDCGGRIALSAHVDGASVHIRVRDSGIGIPAEQLAQVFDLFTQLSPASERAPGGLGIGLALVRTLVELHGGTVSAHSAGPGCGSEFVVRLPRLPDATEGESAQASAPSQARAPTPRHILIADDNADALESLAALLQMAGHEVDTALDGERALEIAARRPPQIALLDLGMPRLDGWEVARRIRAQPWGEGIVLVAVTGWSADEDRRRTRAAGFDTHLLKPLNLETLEQVLEQLPRLPASVTPA